MSYTEPKGMIPLKFAQVQRHHRQYRAASDKHYVDAEEWITKNMNYTEVKIRQRYFFFGEFITTRIPKTRTSWEARQEWDNSYRSIMFKSIMEFGIFLSRVERLMIAESINEVLVDVNDFNDFEFNVKMLLKM